MNLIGRVCIVAVFIMSILFMAFAFMVYATHRDWPTLVREREQEVRTQRNRNNELQQEMARVRASLELETAARMQVLTVLESRAARLGNELRAKNQSLSELRGQHNEAIATMKLAQEELGKLNDGVQLLRGQTDKARAERDDELQKVVALQDRLGQREGAARRLKDRNDELTGAR